MKSADHLEVFDHDTDVDVTHKINSIELDNWINHLKYLEKELLNLINLCSKDLKMSEDESNVLTHLQKKGEENEDLLNAMLSYSASRTNIIECEDTECDMVYIAEHETYRRSYLYHVDQYRRYKDEFFNEVQGNISLIKSKK